jgi:hypothetical protein
MTTNKITKKALDIGKAQAKKILAHRVKALRRRAMALKAHAKKSALAVPPSPPRGPAAVGVLVAEGDSWFDYPFMDILHLLDDDYGYDVESVAHRGDPIEEMAYGDGQLDDLTRRLEKVQARGQVPKAILLSGGGNDVAGNEFGMLLNHARSAIAGLNEKVLDGVINERIRTAYVTILSAVTMVCQQQFDRTIPILVHGYDYPVPDGRGFMGGWWLLPGPWLEPGFRKKGFSALLRRIELAKHLIDSFNGMLVNITGLADFEHVSHIDLRGTLPTGAGYRKWWANELHPTHKGFKSVTKKFVTKLEALP